MAKVIEHEIESGRYWFTCPGCGDRHDIPTNKHDQMFSPHKWKFNGDIDRPTFSPSLLVRSGHYADSKSKSCWCTYNAEQIANGDEPSSFKCYICHSFIRDGKIEFLKDCTHNLAGKTVELDEIS